MTTRDLLFTIFLTSTAIVAPGCRQKNVGDGGTDTGGDAGKPPRDGGGGTGGQDTSDVTGTIVNVHVLENGEAEVPANPANVSIAALTRDAKGEYKAIPGTLGTDGRFTVQKVPKGTYLLRILHDNERPMFVETAARSLDLGRVVIGRPDAKRIEKSPTELLFNLTGLNPWKEGDMLELFSPGAGAFDFLEPIRKKLAPDATGLGGVTVDAAAFRVPHLIEGGKGDSLYVTQLVSRDAAGTPYISIDRVYKTTSVTQVEGERTTLTGNFSDVQQTPMSFQWKRSLFQGLEKDVHPSAKVAQVAIYVYAEPGNPTRLAGSYAPVVASLVSTKLSDEGVSITYGNPFPSGWGLVALGTSVYALSAAVPGFDKPATLAASISAWKPAGTSDPIPIAPTIGVVRNIKVNGKSAAEPLTGVGKTPSVSWSAPPLGEPTSYYVSIRKLDSKGAETLAVVHTAETSITLPPEVLESGSYYYMLIGAETGTDPTKPFKPSVSSASAEALTNIISP